MRAKIVWWSAVSSGSKTWTSRPCRHNRCRWRERTPRGYALYSAPGTLAPRHKRGSPFIFVWAIASRTSRSNNACTNQADIHVVGTFSNAEDVLAGCVEADHILVYDLTTARTDGISGMMELHRLPRAKILIFDVADDDHAIIECVRIGAFGSIL